jgi:3-isopropylmalate/(R)-2-methylmalate dehydratase small subunit
VEPFTVVRGVAAPLMRPDVDTDVLAPAHGGRGDPARSCFAPIRYLPDGREDPSFVLNQGPFRGAPILLAGHNFGCGSSRENAVWSLQALGIRCVIAPSFGDIFFGNCFQNGLLPIVLEAQTLDWLAEEAAAGTPMVVDLRSSALTSPGGTTIPFAVNPTRREQLLDGLDDLTLGLRRLDLVRAFQAADRQRRPWIYDIPGIDEGATP